MYSCNLPLLFFFPGTRWNSGTSRPLWWGGQERRTRRARWWWTPWTPWRARMLLLRFTEPLLDIVGASRKTMQLFLDATGSSRGVGYPSTSVFQKLLMLFSVLWKAFWTFTGTLNSQGDLPLKVRVLPPQLLTFLTVCVPSGRPWSSWCTWSWWSSRRQGEHFTHKFPTRSRVCL